ncbi:unnamed protein product, partial [marine sediment metagenome]
GAPPTTVKPDPSIAYIQDLRTVNGIRHVLDRILPQNAVSELLRKSRAGGESLPPGPGGSGTYLDTYRNNRSEIALLQAVPAAWVQATARHDRVRRRLVASLESPWLDYVPKRGWYPPRTARRIRQCNVTFGVMHAWKDGAKWLVLPMTCDSVACPHCARLRSIDRARRSARIPGLADANLRCITLTIQNPHPGQLVNSMDRMGKAFHQFRRHQSGEAWS